MSFYPFFKNLIFKSSKLGFGKFRNPGGRLGEAQNSNFEISFGPFLSLGRPWTVWKGCSRFVCTCKLGIGGSGGPKQCFYVFLAPGGPKPHLFMCFGLLVHTNTDNEGPKST